MAAGVGTGVGRKQNRVRTRSVPFHLADGVEDAVVKGARRYLRDRARATDAQHGPWMHGRRDEFQQAQAQG